jgi:anaerobic selenocysteine-containing dehydrogenase
MSVDGEVPGACPLDCPDTCSWVVTIQNGEATALRGDRRHPYTRGALCAKVNRFLEYTRSPDRLLYPQRRSGRKGEGRFTRISWDEARVYNDRGRFRATVRISDRTRPGVAVSSKGFWPKQVTGAANANATVAERDSDMGGFQGEGFE